MGPIARLATSLATRQVARTLGGASAGPVGVVVGVALPMLVRALGPAGMVGLALGGMVVRRALERRQANRP
jgi:hypothetical protein